MIGQGRIPEIDDDGAPAVHRRDGGPSHRRRDTAGGTTTVPVRRRPLAVPLAVQQRSAGGTTTVPVRRRPHTGIPLDPHREAPPDIPRPRHTVGPTRAAVVVIPITLPQRFHTSSRAMLPQCGINGMSAMRLL